MHWEGRKNVMVHDSYTNYSPSQGFRLIEERVFVGGGGQEKEREIQD